MTIGCYSREEKEIRGLIGKKIDLEGPLIFFDSAHQYNCKPNEPLIRIITTLDDNECYTCSFKQLINLQVLIQKESNLYPNVNIWAIANNIDIGKAQEELLRWDLKSVIISDSTNYFVKKNKLDKILYRNRFFIIDCNDHIVFVGNPLIRNQLKPLFIKIINNLQTNGGVIKN